MRTFDRQAFVAGLNQQFDASKIDSQSGEYYLLSNARARRNVIRPIRRPRDITSGLPTTGTIQGVYAINSYQIVFVAGQAFWKNFDPEGATWNKIGGFQMSATAERIWLELIPASTINFTRKSTDDTNKRAPIALGGGIGGSPQCAIVMDGESQPWVIFPDVTARVTRTYAQWVPETGQEYVPAGCRYPMFHAGVLYCIGKDERGVYNQLLRSVTGRPLDFVIAVNSAGDKISPSELIGGAPALAYQADFGETTCLKRIPSVESAFLLTTIQNSHLILPDFEDLVFNEPNFRRQFLFNVGALNSECVVDMLGNTALIHYSGIRDFNSIQTLRNEGRNSPISQRINDLLADISQTYGAAIDYDNYSVFALKTRYGPSVVWYDNMLQQFVSVDILDGINAEVKQFASTLTRTTRRLFFVTADNRLYEYDPAVGETSTVRFHLMDFTPSSAAMDTRVQAVRLNFGPIRAGGNIQATVTADSRICQTLAVSVLADTLIDGTYDPIPYPHSINETGAEITFDFEEARQAQRAGVTLEWNCDADLQSMAVMLDDAPVNVSERTKSAPYLATAVQTVAFVGNDGDTDTQRAELVRVIQRERPDYVIGVGNLAYSAGAFSDFAARWTPYWAKMRALGKYFAVPGSSELTTEVGEPFYQTLLQAPTRYFVVTLTHARLFMFNSGYDVGGFQVEEDNLDGGTLGTSRQGLWLAEQLAGQSDGHRIVVMAHPPYSSVIAKARPALRTLDLSGAGAVVSADAGLYERLSVNAKPYFTVGTGSANHLETVPSDTIDESYAVRSAVGYLRARIWPLSIEFSFVGLDGVVWDQYIVRR